MGDTFAHLSDDEIKQRLEAKYNYFDMAEAFCEGGLAMSKMVQLSRFDRTPGPKDLRHAFDQWMRRSDDSRPSDS
jgi:hypothetical protein